MSRAISSLLALLLLVAGALPVAAEDSKVAPVPETDAPPVVPAAGEVVPGEVIVKFRADEEAGEVAQAQGLEIMASVDDGDGELPTVASTGGMPVEQVLAELRADPAVEYAEPSYRVQVLDDGAVTGVGVNDPLTAGQYSLDRMRVRDAWVLSKGGSGIVAVLDTGVQPDHPDLAGRVLPGRDFVNDDANAADDNGHGTWVAGIIAATPDDGYGIAGISWSDKVLPVKIMDASGTGSTADLVSGIVWAADNGATVINMSVGGFPYSQAVQDAVTYAWNKGAVLVGAAGNNNRDEKFYPASMTHVISVSATQREDEFSHWSSYGSAVDVSAPGSSVQTTNCTSTACPNRSWGAHTYISGTSFATPNVAGVVALIRAKYPTWAPQQVVDRLLSTVDDLGSAGWDSRYGRGRVNAYRALGASVAASPRPPGDALETNNTLSAARVIPLGIATRPSIYPAGDTDVFAVDVPRAGRLDVRVTGVVDTRAYPWTKSSLKIDPVVELYTTAGTLLTRVDAVWEDGTELAQATVAGPTRILVRVANYFANGNRASYTITPSFVDTVAPKVTSRLPAPGAMNVSRFVRVVVGFDEPVTNVATSTVLVRDMVTAAVAPATVAYDAGRREAILTVAAKLAAERLHRVEVTSGVRDSAGNALSPTSWTFTTGVSGFSDTIGSPFDYDIAWLAENGITAGCGGDRFCPKSTVKREQMASFLGRALALAPTTLDYFTDDSGSPHEADIDRLAGSGITGGCAQARFCPSGSVTREQMASFLARALQLPPATSDFFADDGGSPHEGDINRLAQAGITGGCGAGTFCPRATITREQMAAFLHRALGD